MDNPPLVRPAASSKDVFIHWIVFLTYHISLHCMFHMAWISAVLVVSLIFSPFGVITLFAFCIFLMICVIIALLSCISNTFDNIEQSSLEEVNEYIENMKRSEMTDGIFTVQCKHIRMQTYYRQGHRRTRRRVYITHQSKHAYQLIKTEDQTLEPTRTTNDFVFLKSRKNIIFSQEAGNYVNNMKVFLHNRFKHIDRICSVTFKNPGIVVKKKKEIVYSLSGQPLPSMIHILSKGACGSACGFCLFSCCLFSLVKYFYLYMNFDRSDFVITKLVVAGYCPEFTQPQQPQQPDPQQQVVVVQPLIIQSQSQSPVVATPPPENPNYVTGAVDGYNVPSAPSQPQPQEIPMEYVQPVQPVQQVTQPPVQVVSFQPEEQITIMGPQENQY